MDIISSLNILKEVKSRLSEIGFEHNFDSNEFITIDFQIPAVNLLKLLDLLNNKSKLYWKNRDSSFEALGADNIFYGNYLTDREIEEFEKYNIKFYISRKFDVRSRISQKWKKFDRNFVFLPLWSIERRADEYYFVLNMNRYIFDEYISKGIERCAAFNTLKTIEDNESDLINYEKSFCPSLPIWKNNLEMVDELNKAGMIKKIVLARLEKYKFLNHIRPISIFNQLINNSENSFAFYFQADVDSVFMGISPELLFSMEKNSVYCDVLAGTAPRGDNEDDDKKLAGALLNDAKEIKEHNYVAKYILKKLEKISKNIEYDNTISVKKLINVQHLFSLIKCVKSDNITNWKLLKLLYPTPAVCGLPKKKTKRLINEIEQFDRGHYAGAIGILSKDKSEICVGIRSALFYKNCLYVYAGAGIVAGSNAEKEWKEIANKMKNYTDCFDDNKF